MRPARRRFFKILLDGLVAVRVTRPHREGAEAARVQQVPDRALGHDHAEASLHHPLEIDAAPAHHPVHRHVGARLHDPIELSPLRRVQQAGARRTGPIQEPRDPIGIVPVDPVPQRLPLHPGARCRCRARLAIEDGRERQTAAGLSHISARPSRAPQIIGAQIQSRDRKGHRVVPARPRKTLNHPKPDPSSKNESDPAAVGMRHPPLAHSGRSEACRMSTRRHKPSNRCGSANIRCFRCCGQSKPSSAGGG